MVEITGAGGRLIVMLRGCVADCGPALLESVTLTVKFAGPLGPVGVPVIAPVPVLRLNPVGSAPLVVENDSGVVPPVAAMAGGS